MNEKGVEMGLTRIGSNMGCMVAGRMCSFQAARRGGATGFNRDADVIVSGIRVARDVAVRRFSSPGYNIWGYILWVPVSHDS